MWSQAGSGWLLACVLPSLDPHDPGPARGPDEVSYSRGVVSRGLAWPRPDRQGPAPYSRLDTEAGSLEPAPPALHLLPGPFLPFLSPCLSPSL